MDINIIDKENCKKEFDAVLTYEELKPHFEKALIEYRKKAQIPGFRKGKVPLDMVRKLYWDAVEYSALEEIANEVFKNHLLENNIPIFGTGSLLDLDYKPKEKLILKVAFEIIPVVELKQIKDIELTKTKYVVDDSLIDEELQYMKLKNATYEMDGKALDNNYMVTMNTDELDEAGNVIEGRSQKDVKLFIGSEYLSKEYYEGIKGLKENEERTIDTKNEQGEPVKVKLLCTKVEKIIYPEINEETILKMTGKDDIKTEEALRVFLKEEIGKDPGTYRIVKRKLVVSYFPDNIVGNRNYNFKLIFFLYCNLFKFIVPEFKQKPDHLFFGIKPQSDSLYRFWCNNGRSGQVFGTRVFVPVLEILFLPQFINLVVKYRL